MVLFTFFLVCLCRINCFGKEAECDVNIRYVNVKLPVIKAYVDLKCKDGTAVENILKENIEAKLNGKDVEVKDVRSLKDTEEGTAYTFLIDTSLSFSSENREKIAKSIKNWIGEMGKNDEAAILTFGSKVEILQNFTSDHYLIQKKIEEVKSTDNQTCFYEGIIKAIELAGEKEEALSMNKAVIILTDGQDDSEGKVTKEQVFTKLQEFRVPIYTIGFWDRRIEYKEKEDLRNLLKKISETSSGRYYEGSKSPLEGIYSTMYQDIKNNHILELYCKDCKYDGTSYSLNITFLNSASKGSGKYTSFFPYKDEEMEEKEKADLKKPQNEEEALKEKQEKAKSIDSNSTAVKNLDKYYEVATFCMAVVAILVTACILYRKHKKPKAAVGANEEGDGEYMFSDSRLGEDENLQRNYCSLRTLNSVDKSGGKSFINVAIKVIEDRERQYKFRMEEGDAITIGKEAECSILLEDEALSDVHCEITYRYNMLMIQDLSSSKETYINGTRIRTTYKLNNKDLIYIGSTLLTIEM